MATRAAAAATEPPVPTVAPTSAVIPAFLRNALRFRPAFCDMRLLPRVLCKDRRRNRFGRWYTARRLRTSVFFANRLKYSTGDRPALEAVFPTDDARRHASVR